MPSSALVLLQLLKGEQQECAVKFKEIDVPPNAGEGVHPEGRRIEEHVAVNERRDAPCPRQLSASLSDRVRLGWSCNHVPLPDQFRQGDLDLGLADEVASRFEPADL